MATTAEDQTQTQNMSGRTNPLKTAVGNNQMANKATQFAKDRPWTTAALAGVVGMALLNTFRGKGVNR